MNVATIASWALRIAGILALLIGLELWSGGGGVMVPIHMLLGIIAVIAVWILGVLQARVAGGSRGLMVAALAFGLLVPVLGILQLSGGPLVQLIHVLVALGVIGMGEVCAGRLRRATPATA
jgi:hypothetical protein